jgi:CRISPR-associated endonuclease Cas3-HD
MLSIITSVSDIDLFKGINNLDNIVKLIAYLHDIGKATSFFQKKLLNESLKQNELCYTKHSLLGAVLVFI